MLRCPSGSIEDIDACILPGKIIVPIDFQKLKYNLLDESTDCSYFNVTMTSTANPPQILSDLLTGNNLKIAVEHIFVNGRTVTDIILSDKPECNYPGSNFVKSVDGSVKSSCKVSFQSEVSVRLLYSRTFTLEKFHG